VVKLIHYKEDKKKRSTAYGNQKWKENKRFTKKKVTKKAAAESTSLTVPKLVQGKKYYVRMRAYKTIKGKKKYGKWSNIKNVTVKKAIAKAAIKTVSSPDLGKLKITWKKLSKISGYQVQIAGNAKFQNGKQNKAVSAKSTSLTISKLTQGKRYYVRMRAYKAVKGKKEYGKWSNTKSVVIKKKAATDQDNMKKRRHMVLTLLNIAVRILIK